MYARKEFLACDFNVDVSSMVDAGASPGEVAGRDPGTSAKLAGVRRLPAPE